MPSIIPFAACKCTGGTTRGINDVPDGILNAVDKPNASAMKYTISMVSVLVKTSRARIAVDNGTADQNENRARHANQGHDEAQQ
jgi:hypothetical protein